jgi:hypothetical protein
MRMGTGFERAYVELLAALWLDLERLAGQAAATDTGGRREGIELGAEIVLLELAVLEGAADRWRATRLVTAAERERLRDLAASLGVLVGRIAEVPVAATAEAFACAQNRIFNELRARAAPLAAGASRAG